nr:enolase C-terminal domain-like protein [Mesorhizobium sp. WSM4875]
MKITGIRIYRKDLTPIDGLRRKTDPMAVPRPSNIVVLDTDAEISGCGEFCPAGNNYLEAHSEGTESVAKLLAPVLIGQDPRRVACIERLMDASVTGHGYAKSAIDMACWDILGKVTGQPLWMLFGGAFSEALRLFISVYDRPPPDLPAMIDKYRDVGYKDFQIKLGKSTWQADIERLEVVAPLMKRSEVLIGDANKGWRVDEAIEVARATRHLNYIMEEPCRTYEEILAVRRMLDRPLKLDECITDIRAARRVVEDRSAEFVCLKISKQGGISKTKRMRDFLVDSRIPVILDDSWGGEITAAAVTHLAASTPPEFMAGVSDLHNYHNETVGSPAPVTRDGHIFSPNTPGLGVEPDLESLGKPVAHYRVS